MVGVGRDGGDGGEDGGRVAWAGECVREASRETGEGGGREGDKVRLRKQPSAVSVIDRGRGRKAKDTRCQ